MTLEELVHSALKSYAAASASTASAIEEDLVDSIFAFIADKDTAIQELDLRRQEQIENQRNMLTMNQKKFARIISILGGTSGSNFKLDRIRQTIVADADEVASWRH